jgi:hypothetical protein
MAAAKDVVANIIQPMAMTTKIEGEKPLLAFHVPAIAVNSYRWYSDLARSKPIDNSR